MKEKLKSLSRWLGHYKFSVKLLPTEKSPAKQE